MAYKAWFECFNNQCRKKYSLTEVRYNCGDCGALLQVVHDYDEIRKTSSREWRSKFEERKMHNTWPYGSGVWRFKEWVLPNLDNENIVSTYEGETNLFLAERLGEEIGVPDLWIKLCGNSHTGSFKDLGMTVLVSMVKQIIANGGEIRAVACASTGDTSAALAAYCATAGIQSIVFLPKGKVSNEQLIQPIANGSLVISLETDFDGCMKVVQEVAKDKTIYLANSKNSLRIEGQKTVSIELAQQLDWEIPDFVIIPGGNLGNVSALGKGFKLMEKVGMLKKRPRIVCAQAEMANPLYRYYKNGYKNYEAIQAQKTYASAIQIGDPVSLQKAVATLKEFDGIVEQASEQELADACARGDRSGMYTCPHTGVALAALLKLVDRGEITSKDKVAVISTAHGLKFSKFKLDYHEGRLPDIDNRYSNLPVAAPPDVDAVLRIIDQRLGD
ncbi:Threonine synthase [hydrothermal vent metagenome]|uniref:Threonine synthase n=1 Tax=hydrothermal vent metagenome TaxID=652676 RepID=A0A3B1CFH6_9ZZZZ